MLVCPTAIYIYIYIYIYTYIYIYNLHTQLRESSHTCLRASLHTGWRRVLGCLIFIGHFPQKSPTISGSLAKNDKQLKASYGSSQPCTRLLSHTPHTHLPVVEAEQVLFGNDCSVGRAVNVAVFKEIIAHVRDEGRRAATDTLRQQPYRTQFSKVSKRPNLLCTQNATEFAVYVKQHD